MIVLLLRREILAAIPFLTRMKAPGFEFEFGKRLDDLESRADDAELPPVDEAMEDLIGPEFARLYALAQVNARSAILEAWLLVETSISEVAAELGIDTIGPQRSLRGQLKQLAARFPRSRELASIVDELRQLRNRAVHEYDFSLGEEDTLEYIALAIRVSNALREPIQPS